jgi:DNA-binding MarR family transcriptional regulator
MRMMSQPLLSQLLESIPPAYHRLGACGDLLHAPLGLSSGMRALLLSIDRLGPMTVSRLAAMRPVSRQFVQRLTDEMLTGGWVVTALNPNHKRSPLVVLTDKGRAALRTMEEVEAPYLEELGAGLSADEIATATRLLRIIADRISPEVLEQLADGADPVSALAAVHG